MCYKDVTEVLPVFLYACYRGVTECYSNVSQMIQGNSRGLTGVLHGCFMDVTGVLHGFYRDVSKIL